MNGVFYCYSVPLRNELMGIGERYVAKIVNPSTNKDCWLFLYNDNLTKYLSNRPKSSYIKKQSLS